MSWKNSHRLLPRAKAKCLTEDRLYRIDWAGSQFIIKRIGGKSWSIRHLTTGSRYIFSEIQGYGKEEAISWIENNF